LNRLGKSSNFHAHAEFPLTTARPLGETEANAKSTPRLDLFNAAAICEAEYMINQPLKPL
jgi:hypothetical protein